MDSTRKSKSSSCRVLEDFVVCRSFPQELVEKGFGEVRENEVFLFPEEALYLAEKGLLDLDFEELLDRFRSRAKSYAVYKLLRDRGYVIKSGAKYGVHFRVYERSKEREHSRFLVFVLDARKEISAHELLGLNRVAHSVRKRLWLAIVDDELDVVFIQLLWVKP